MPDVFDPDDFDRRMDRMLQKMRAERDGMHPQFRAGMECAAQISMDHRMILDKSSEHACRAIAAAIRKEIGNGHPRI